MLSENQIKIVLGIAVAVWAVSLLLAGVDVKPAWFQPFSTVCGAVVLVLALMDR